MVPCSARRRRKNTARNVQGRLLLDGGPYLNGSLQSALIEQTSLQVSWRIAGRQTPDPRYSGPADQFLAGNRSNFFFQKLLLPVSLPSPVHQTGGLATREN